MSPAASKIRTSGGYQEPDLEDDGDITVAPISYPPPSQNPFNQSRPSVQKFGNSGGSVTSGRSTSDADTLSRIPSNPTQGNKALGESELNPTDQGPLNFDSTPKIPLTNGSDPVVLGVAVVDFNHVVGPTVEWSYPESLTKALKNDEGLSRLLPFLALPDGAHLSEEDYSYFHCVYSPSQSFSNTDEQSEKGEDETDTFPAKQTIFGISCNRQIAASDLLHKASDVTRSTVQKAVVVLASRPVFGPIRDKLGVVTRAFFAQRDFSQTDLLPQFYLSLEFGLQGKESEGGMYIGTSLRDFLYKFRHRTLTLVKMMMLQKRILFYGYPVEKLCTYQYSLISLMPGLLMNLADAGDPSLDFRSESAKKPTSLRTSDRNSLLRYMGLPLHTFGKDSFFQPYLPLQQIDMLTAKSWLVGTTNSIVTQQRDCQWDLLINIEQNTFEFHDKELERLVTLTPSDRAWMDQVVRSVEDTWNPADPTRPMGMVFRGSDDDLRGKFEEYICSVLATLKYSDYVRKDQNTVMPGGEVAPNFAQPYSEKWLDAFRQTSAYDTWNKSTDDLLFDICEPRHPCEGKTSAVSDIGIRLAEGFHDLHLHEQLGPTREAIGTAIAAGSTSLYRAFDGMRSEVANRLREREAPAATALKETRSATTETQAADAPPSTITAIPDFRSTIGGFGSFFGSKLASIQHAVSAQRQSVPSPITSQTPTKTGLRPLNLSAAASPPKKSRESRPTSSSSNI
ncbi:hypothetical protein NliqN6_2503 [Naganishia liquefaciens]|uniref:UDENN domain-containing protein n=1 Tax=Naganishia liquefaciens TaxID=104408 RepID=A0A8H3TRH6_9TREE|nr:hypothetical protein NliqN6_2503 [Naganishia liquefaciens]